MRTPASARMCAESQICTAFVLIGTKPTLVHIGGYFRARAATLITGSYTYGLRAVERRPVPTVPRSAPAMAMVQTVMLALASMCQLIRSALGSPRGRDSA